MHILFCTRSASDAHANNKRLARVAYLEHRRAHTTVMFSVRLTFREYDQHTHAHTRKSYYICPGAFQWRQTTGGLYCYSVRVVLGYYFWVVHVSH